MGNRDVTIKKGRAQNPILTAANLMSVKGNPMAQNNTNQMKIAGTRAKNQHTALASAAKRRLTANGGPPSEEAGEGASNTPAEEAREASMVAKGKG
jgi:hypothetical protein